MSNRPWYLHTLDQHWIMYRVGPKKVSRKLLSISLPNIDRFSNFFHRHILWKICNKVSTKYTHHTLNASLRYLVIV